MVFIEEKTESKGKEKMQRLIPPYISNTCPIGKARRNTAPLVFGNSTPERSNLFDDEYCNVCFLCAWAWQKKRSIFFALSRLTCLVLDDEARLLLSLFQDKESKKMNLKKC